MLTAILIATQVAGLQPADEGPGPVGPTAEAGDVLALRAGESARVHVQCAVLEDRRYGDCEIAAENPPGEGFGEASLRLLERRFNAPDAPRAREDAAIGTTIRIPLIFRLED